MWKILCACLHVFMIVLLVLKSKNMMPQGFNVNELSFTLKTSYFHSNFNPVSSAFLFL